MLATKCCPRCNQDTVNTFVTLQPQPQKCAGYCRLIVSRPGIAVSHRYFLSLHLFLCHQLFCEKWLGLRAAVRRVTLETDTSWARSLVAGVLVWPQFTVWCRSRGQSRAQEGPASCVMCHDDAVPWATITTETICFKENVSECWNKDN